MFTRHYFLPPTDNAQYAVWPDLDTSSIRSAAAPVQNESSHFTTCAAVHSQHRYSTNQATIHQPTPAYSSRAVHLRQQQHPLHSILEMHANQQFTGGRVLELNSNNFLTWKVRADKIMDTLDFPGGHSIEPASSTASG